MVGSRALTIFERHFGDVFSRQGQDPSSALLYFWSERLVRPIPLPFEMPTTTQVFLQAVGLPIHFNWNDSSDISYLHFIETAEHRTEQRSGKSYLVFAGQYGLDFAVEERTGKIVLLNEDDSDNVGFVNSDIEAFVYLATQYVGVCSALQEAGGKPEEAEVIRLSHRHLSQVLLEIDPVASADPNSWWAEAIELLQEDLSFHEEAEE